MNGARARMCGPNKSLTSKQLLPLFLQGLRAVGCDTLTMEWSGKQDIKEMIESTLKKVKHKCSLIMVGVMSHGCRGCLLGSHGDAIPINDIVHLFHTQLPDEVPLVSVCQEKCLQLPFHHIHWDIDSNI